MAKLVDLSGKTKVGKVGWKDERSIPTFPTKVGIVGAQIKTLPTVKAIEALRLKYRLEKLEQNI